MTLPSSGPMSIEMINVELKRATTAAWNMNGAEERKLAAVPSGAYSFANFYGKSNEIVKYVTTSGWGPDLIKNLFTAEEWASDVQKIVQINSGVEIGHPTRDYALAITDNAGGQAGSFNGALTLRNYGVISGRRGYPNAGQGGQALYCNFAGRNGAKMRIENYGYIRGGGGAGGYGGTGGQGGNGYYVAENWSEWRANGSNRLRVHIASKFPIRGPGGEIIGYIIDYEHEYYWDGSQILRQVKRDDKNPVSQWIGSYYYQIGGRYGGDSSTDNYQMRRKNDYNVYTTGGAGGAGGAGGYGQGYGYNATPGNGGSGGGAPQTNAGWGGTGGTGGSGGAYGNYGGTGATGNTGGAGNNGGGYAGTAGQAGGPPGYYINGSWNVTLVNNGVVQGLIV